MCQFYKWKLNGEICHQIRGSASIKLIYSFYTFSPWMLNRMVLNKDGIRCIASKSLLRTCDYHWAPWIFVMLVRERCQWKGKIDHAFSSGNNCLHIGIALSHGIRENSKISKACFRAWCTCKVKRDADNPLWDGSKISHFCHMLLMSSILIFYKKTLNVHLTTHF